MIDNDLLQVLACPACRKALEPQESEKIEGLCCPACLVVYPITDNIPVMLKEEAILLSDWKSGKRKK